MAQHKSVLPIPQSNLHRVVRIKLTVYEIQQCIAILSRDTSEAAKALADEFTIQLEAESVRKNFMY